MYRPTVGRIVHYTDARDAQGNLWPPDVPPTMDDVWPAIIVAAKQREAAAGEHYTIEVTLGVFYDDRRAPIEYLRNVPFSMNPLARGCWNWPPRD